MRRHVDVDPRLSAERAVIRGRRIARRRAERPAMLAFLLGLAIAVAAGVHLSGAWAAVPGLLFAGAWAPTFMWWHRRRVRG